MVTNPNSSRPAALGGATAIPAWEARVADSMRAVSPSASLVAALFLAVAVGVIDAAYVRNSGVVFAVTLLYLLPVGIAAWKAGVVAGLVVSVVAAAAELAAGWIGLAGLTERTVRLGPSGLLQLLLFAGVAVLADALRRHLDRERDLSRTDPVTGLANRRAFEEAAELERLRARRSSAPISLAYVDLDDFKAVNDTHGHGTGDKVLRAVGATLRASVRDTDLVARLGGDEFGLLLPGAQPAAASAVGTRIQERMTMERHETPTVSASIGVATFLGPPASAEALLGAADAAMYEAKRGSSSVSCVVIRPEEAAAAGERPGGVP